MQNRTSIEAPSQCLTNPIARVIALVSLFFCSQLSFAQSPDAEQEIKDVSKIKWEWMAEKNVEALSGLFHERAKFVHMSGTWNTPRELDIIESGSIWYKKADVHDVVVELFGDTAIVWNRITLLAVVRGNEVSNEFTVTEVYQKAGDEWRLLDLTFSSVRDTHGIQQ
ncbi:hypothetical protein VDG1235_3674 [Verrucomicrobiia bacterium DG1235]|nr:hypothetical protein VDG1235_3674 [Verrucomicrobiae bacterium DG1235]